MDLQYQWRKPGISTLVTLLLSGQDSLRVEQAPKGLTKNSEFLELQMIARVRMIIRAR